MSDNWVVQNLENALNTWNTKMAEVWSLLTMSPQNFKGGGIWHVILQINGAVKGIGLALLVLFFLMGVVKTSGSPEPLVFRFDVDGENFTSAGQASAQVKKNLRELGFDPETIRRVAIAMYEGEINMVIHAGGGEAVVSVSDECVEIRLIDHGPGIANIEQAMQEGFSTAPDNIRSLGFGAGMGLPNMKRYTDYMHIDSTVGKGTTITMKVNY